MLAHAQLLEKRTQGRIDVYFVGDSITRRWGATDYPEFLANWKQNFFGWNAADFGWGADRTENILWRLENGELDGVNPKVIVMLAGTNNIGNAQPPGTTTQDRGHHRRRPRRSSRRCRQQGAQRDDRPHGHLSAQRQHGGDAGDRSGQQQPGALADGSRVRYLNINDRLADAKGRLFDGMMGDKLHPTLRAIRSGPTR